jgi:hypothetical protein
MRSMCRTVVVALSAVCVVGAVASASASAAECPGTVEGGGIALCSGGHEQKGTFAFTGVQKSESYSDPFNLEGGGIPLTVSCNGLVKLSKGSFVATSGKLEISGLYLSYGECGVSSDETDCEVTTHAITVDGAEGAGTGPGLSASLASTAEVTLLGGGTSRKWTKFVVRGKPGHACTTSRTETPRGQVTCGLPESTVEAVTHILKCEFGNSALTSSGLQVGFALTGELKLSSGKAWSLQKI